MDYVLASPVRKLHLGGKRDTVTRPPASLPK